MYIYTHIYIINIKNKKNWNENQVAFTGKFAHIY